MDLVCPTFRIRHGNLVLRRLDLDRLCPISILPQDVDFLINVIRLKRDAYPSWSPSASSSATRVWTRYPRIATDPPLMYPFQYVFGCRIEFDRPTHAIIPPIRSRQQPLAASLTAGIWPLVTLRLAQLGNRLVGKDAIAMSETQADTPQQLTCVQDAATADDGRDEAALAQNSPGLVGGCAVPICRRTRCPAAIHFDEAFKGEQ